MLDLIEKLREKLNQVMDSQDGERRLKISIALDEAIVAYMREREKTNAE